MNGLQKNLYEENVVMLKKRDWFRLCLFLLPIIDFLSFLNPILYNISLGIKGFFLLYAIAFTIKNKKHTKVYGVLGIYFFIYFCFVFINHSTPWLEVINTLTIFALPIFILFFSNYENEKVTKKTMTILSLIYIFLYFLTLIFHLKTDVSLFNLFLLFISVSMIYIIESKSYLLKGIYFIFFCLLAVVIHAKSFYFSLFFLILYFTFLNLKKIVIYCQKNRFKVLITLLVLCLCLSVYIPKQIVTNDIHNQVNMQELFSYSHSNSLLSGRLENIKNRQKTYVNSEALEKVLGLEIDKLETKKVENDIFDVFYSIGILGLIFYFFFFAYVLKNSELKKNYKGIFIFFLCISCLGNVLINPYVILFLSLLFLISKNDNGVMQKDILLVSNMYPDENHPHYGIFVKNTYDILKEEYSIDLVVMHKTTGKVKKLVAYIKMCGSSLLKALFHNYDYIYVHFISHTTAGVFIPAITSRAKLVLNVHGNDLVPDTKVDKNYMKLSKLFLRGADVVIAPSSYFANILTKEYKLPKDKIVIYPSGGVDIEKFKKINKKTALKNAGLDNKYKYYGFVARLEKDKGYDTFIKAIDELNKKKKCTNIRFLLIGSGSEEEKCNALIKKYKLERKIIRKPLVSQEELVNIYNVLEAFIYPTRMKSESLGLTGLEAMACEVLVIGSNQFGPSDYLINEENSLTFNPESYKELATKIELSLELTAREKSKVTKNARKKSEEYSYEATKKIILEVFKK